MQDTIFTAELASRLGFTSEGGTFSVWHLRQTAVAGAPPDVAYLPLARFDRPDTATFVAQLPFLRSYADLRPDRSVEIAEQLATPVPFLASIGLLRADSKRWTLTLLEVALDLARLVEQRVKHALACRRPIEFSPQIQPIIETPGHGTLPSGHATEAFAAARVLGGLLAVAGDPYGDPGYSVQVMRLASRIAVNRTVAGVHFPIDSVAGAMLGLTLADYLMARAGVGARTFRAAHFDGTAAGVAGRDFLWSDIFNPAAGVVRFAPGDGGAHPAVREFNAAVGGNVVDVAEAGDDAQATPSPLVWLWRRAVAEWT